MLTVAESYAGVIDFPANHLPGLLDISVSMAAAAVVFPGGGASLTCKSVGDR